MTLLLADIGGTNTRCALAPPSGDISPVTTYRNADHPGLAELLTGYMATLPAASRPAMAALSVAAPIRGDDVHMVNIDWAFSRQVLQQRLGLRALHVLNDFAALAWSLPALAARDLAPIGGGTATAGGAKVVLGPGTGLGVASLVACADGWMAIPGEGGHVTLAAQDEEEEAVIRVARERFGHCSAERVLSGPGLSFLHETLHGAAGLAPAEIGRLAGAGDPRATVTLGMFFRLLGTVAGDAALTLGAYGGVYIGGGIVPRYIEAFRRSGFREHFEAKGRYREYMRAIPTWVISAPDPALRGLVAFARRGAARA